MNMPLLFRRLKQSLGLFLIASLFCMSCKKENPAPPPVNTGGGSSNTTVDIRDTIYAIAQTYYLWNNLLPTYSAFNPHSYENDGKDTFDHEMEAIKAYSPLNSVNNLHYDHFSFILTESDYQAEFVTGVSSSYGMGYSFDTAANLRINYIAHAAPAYRQGVRRGWQLISINGIVAANANEATIAQLNNALGSSSGTFLFQNPGGQQVSLQLTQSAISDDEVITTKVFNEGSKKVGYIAYNTFLTALSANNEPTHPGLDTAFTGLAASGITDIIIDLRYNGGGYTAISEQMDDALIPASFNNTLMYTEHYNDTLNYYYNLLKNDSILHDVSVNVNKNNVQNPSNLNVNSVIFIVSENTASAAELVINNLFPFFPNLKLVGLGLGLPAGTAQRTAGKPFGYAGTFTLPNVNKPEYEMFMINFETKNAQGQDNYVSGFTPDVQTYDGVAYDWGDPNEDGLKAALAYEVNGSFGVVQKSSQIALGNKIARSGVSSLLSSKLFRSNPRFSGMIAHPSSKQVRQKSGVSFKKTGSGKFIPLFRK